jgi:hypothetical protein
MLHWAPAPPQPLPLRTFHDLFDGHFIPEVAIQLQVESIFKMPRSHAVTKVAQHNLRPTEQPLNNVSCRVHVLDTAICTWRCYTCLLSVTMILECIKQFITFPFFNLVSIHWFQESLELLKYKLPQTTNAHCGTRDLAMSTTTS